MSSKRNLVLYVDADLVEKTKELGLNLSKTFENDMKTLIKTLDNPHFGKYDGNNVLIGSPGEIRTLVSGSRARHAWPLHHRALHGAHVRLEYDSL